MIGASSTPIVSVYDGRKRVGFILARGKLGFEAFDRNERSVGMYPTKQEAARALDEARP
jgi:hypothetical protein